jgi:hypothetical protein
MKPPPPCTTSDYRQSFYAVYRYEAVAFVIL